MEGDESMYQAKGSAAVRGNAAKGTGPLFFFFAEIIPFLEDFLAEKITQRTPNTAPILGPLKTAPFLGPPDRITTGKGSNTRPHN